MGLPPPVAAPPFAPTSGGGSGMMGILAGAGGGGAVVVVMLALLLVRCYSRRAKVAAKLVSPKPVRATAAEGTSTMPHLMRGAVPPATDAAGALPPEEPLPAPQRGDAAANLRSSELTASTLSTSTLSTSMLSTSSVTVSVDASAGVDVSAPALAEEDWSRFSTWGRALEGFISTPQGPSREGSEHANHDEPSSCLPTEEEKDVTA